MKLHVMCIDKLIIGYLIIAYYPITFSNCLVKIDINQSSISAEQIGQILCVPRKILCICPLQWRSFRSKSSRSPMRKTRRSARASVPAAQENKE